MGGEPGIRRTSRRPRPRSQRRPRSSPGPPLETKRLSPSLGRPPVPSRPRCSPSPSQTKRFRSSNRLRSQRLLCRLCPPGPTRPWTQGVGRPPLRQRGSPGLPPPTKQRSLQPPGSLGSPQPTKPRSWSPRPISWPGRPNSTRPRSRHPRNSPCKPPPRKSRSLRRRWSPRNQPRRRGMTQATKPSRPRDLQQLRYSRSPRNQSLQRLLNQPPRPPRPARSSCQVRPRRELQSHRPLRWHGGRHRPS